MEVETTTDWQLFGRVVENNNLRIRIIMAVPQKRSSQNRT